MFLTGNVKGINSLSIGQFFKKPNRINQKY